MTDNSADTDNETTDTENDRYTDSDTFFFQFFGDHLFKFRI